MAENRVQIGILSEGDGYAAEIRSGGLHVVTLPRQATPDEAYASAQEWLNGLEQAYCICSTSTLPWTYRERGMYVARHPRGEYVLWDNGFLREIPEWEVVERYWGLTHYRWVDPDDPMLPPGEPRGYRLYWSEESA